MDFNFGTKMVGKGLQSLALAPELSERKHYRLPSEYFILSNDSTS